METEDSHSHSADLLRVDHPGHSYCDTVVHSFSQFIVTLLFVCSS